MHRSDATSAESRSVETINAAHFNFSTEEPRTWKGSSGQTARDQNHLVRWYEATIPAARESAAESTLLKAADGKLHDFPRIEQPSSFSERACRCNRYCSVRLVYAIAVVVATRRNISERQTQPAFDRRDAGRASPDRGQAPVSGTQALARKLQ